MRNKHITTPYNRPLEDRIHTEEYVSDKTSDSRPSIRFLEQSASYPGANLSRKELIMCYMGA